MRQLDALADAAEMPNVVIQVLPFTPDNYVGRDGSIRIYEFADAPTVCYTECYSGGRIVAAPAEVAELMTMLNLIRVSALSPRKSLELLIRQIRREIDDGQPGLAQGELLGVARAVNVSRSMRPAMAPSWCETPRTKATASSTGTPPPNGAPSSPVYATASST